jgi:hypothetical protein
MDINKLLEEIDLRMEHYERDNNRDAFHALELLKEWIEFQIKE